MKFKQETVTGYPCVSCKIPGTICLSNFEKANHGSTGSPQAFQQAHHRFFDRLTKGFFTSLNLRQLTEGKQLPPLIPLQGGNNFLPLRED